MTRLPAQKMTIKRLEVIASGKSAVIIHAHHNCFQMLSTSPPLNEIDAKPTKHM
jgi:hypothetical protein